MNSELTETILLTSSQEDIEKAGKLLAAGELVGIPTETVYGLAASALDGHAVSDIFKAKGRPSDNPLIVHISKLEQLDELVKEVPESAVQLAAAYWPGPLTMIMPASDVIPKEVTAGLDTVAIRLPAHDTARRIIDAAGVPLAAPSANTSGKPSPTKAGHVMHDMNGKIAAVVDGGECRYGVESTVITLCTQPPVLLRPGAVTPDMLRQVIGDFAVNHAVLEKMDENEQAASPGMKYKHYAPDTAITLFVGDFGSYAGYCARYCRPDDWAMCFSGDGQRLNNEYHLKIRYIEYGDENDLLSQAKGLFGALRTLDEVGAKRAFVRCCDPEGVGLAVYNRLVRAAGFNVVNANI